MVAGVPSGLPPVTAVASAALASCWPAVADWVDALPSVGWDVAGALVAVAAVGSKVVVADAFACAAAVALDPAPLEVSCNFRAPFAVTPRPAVSAVSPSTVCSPAAAVAAPVAAPWAWPAIFAVAPAVAEPTPVVAAVLPWPICPTGAAIVEELVAMALVAIASGVAESPLEVGVAGLVVVVVFTIAVAMGVGV